MDGPLRDVGGRGALPEPLSQKKIMKGKNGRKKYEPLCYRVPDSTTNKTLQVVEESKKLTFDCEFYKMYLNVGGEEGRLRVGAGTPSVGEETLGLGSSKQDEKRSTLLPISLRPSLNMNNQSTN